MGAAKKVIEEIAKNSLLVYFIILWGASMFLYAICYLGSWGLGVKDIYDLIWIIANLLDLGAGIFLMIFGVQLLRPDFLKAINREKTLSYFLILWAGQFFFWALYDLIFGPAIVCFLAALIYLFAGVVLALFGFKLLSEKEPTTA
jgi:hypothetical protein